MNDVMTPDCLTDSTASVFDASRSRAGGGTGLGLSVVRGIARPHGDDVLARSGPEGGTVIEMRLPLSAASGKDMPNRG